MKTVRKENEIKRVKDSEVMSVIKQGFALCKKSLWKEKVGDINKKKVVVGEFAVTGKNENKPRGKKS